MAKDGTRRGGKRPGAGRPRKPLADKLADGKQDLTVLNFPDLKMVDIPPPPDWMGEEQLDGTPLDAGKIYAETFRWLADRKCDSLIEPAVVERYAVASARWEQCERQLNRLGLMAKHPTTAQPIQSPYVQMSQSYMTLACRIWSEIFQIVSDNCREAVGGSSPQDDMMERLLRQRGG